MGIVVGAAAQTCRIGWQNGNCEDSVCWQTLYEWRATSKQTTAAISCPYLSPLSGWGVGISQNAYRKCFVILPSRSLHGTGPAAGCADTPRVVNMVTLRDRCVGTSCTVSCMDSELN
jgi:hypothetical protein